MSWQRSYVAVATLLGAKEPVQDLPEEARHHAEPLGRDLGSPDRATRARALAAELARLANALEELELGSS